MIKGHGNDHFDHDIEIEYDFSSNIAYNHNAEPIIYFAATRMRESLRYPDPLCRKITADLAHFHGYGVDQVMVTNGSVEAFYLIAQHFAKGRSCIVIPSFAEYEDACRVFEHELEFLYRDMLFDTDLSGFQTVWIGNPNNPDGKMNSALELRALALEYSTVTFIIDEAYSEFLPFNISLLDGEELPANIVVVHSMTKLFSIPGIRIGYMIASSLLVTKLWNYKQPWSVSSVAQETGSFVVSHYESLLPDIRQLYSESKALQEALHEMDGIEVIDAETHYFICKVQQGTAAELKQLLLEKGILIRNADNFRGLSAQHFRICGQGASQNNILISALADVLPYLKA